VVSQVSESDDKAGKVKEGAIDVGIMFIANDQTAEISQPSEGSLDFPPLAITSEFASILELVLPCATMRANQFDASGLQRGTELVAIIASIGNQALGFAFGPSRALPGYRDGFQRPVHQFHFRGRSFNDSASQRNTRAVDHHHPLRAFAFAGVTDAEPPFFAGAKLPSMKHWLQSSFFLASNSERNARQIFSHSCCCSQSRNRRQQVLALGYILGRSRQRAPVFSTQRMPSNTRRWSLQGRPRLLSLGKRGSIRCHCLSDKNASGILSFSNNRRKSTSTKYLEKVTCETSSRLIAKNNFRLV